MSSFFGHFAVHFMVLYHREGENGIVSDGFFEKLITFLKTVDIIICLSLRVPLSAPVARNAAQAEL
jgi:hypothetical protein